MHTVRVLGWFFPQWVKVLFIHPCSMFVTLWHRGMWLPLTSSDVPYPGVPPRLWVTLCMYTCIQ